MVGTFEHRRLDQQAAWLLPVIELNTMTTKIASTINGNALLTWLPHFSIGVLSGSTRAIRPSMRVTRRR
jgi:hypothetical protein